MSNDYLKRLNALCEHSLKEYVYIHNDYVEIEIEGVNGHYETLSALFKDGEFIFDPMCYSNVEQPDIEEFEEYLSEMTDLHNELELLD